MEARGRFQTAGELAEMAGVKARGCRWMTRERLSGGEKMANE